MRKFARGGRVAAFAIVGATGVACKSETPATQTDAKSNVPTAIGNLVWVSSEQPDAPLPIITNMAVDARQRVFSADFKESVVFAFAGDGSYLTKIRGKGSGPGDAAGLSVSARAQASAARQVIQVKRLETYDGVSDGLPFRMVSAGVLLNAREYVLLDRDSPMLVRVIRAKGVKVGRTGSGPGEYTAPSTLALLGDTLAVIESLSRRLNLFAIGSAPGARTRILAAVPSEGFTNSIAISLTPDGVVHLLSNPDGDSRRTGASNDVKLVWQGRVDGKTKALASLSRPGIGLSIPVLIDGKKFTSATVQPFVAGPLWSASRAGSGIAVVEASPLRPGDVVEVTLLQWRADGSDLRTCNWSQPVPTLTSAAYNRGTSRLFHCPRITACKTDIDREVVRPTHAPFATDLQLASDGTVWLRTSAQYFQETDTYIRISAADCAKRDVVQFDALVRVLDARNDAVLVAGHADDAAVAKIYQLVRPGNALPEQGFLELRGRSVSLMSAGHRMPLNAAQNYR